MYGRQVLKLSLVSLTLVTPVARAVDQEDVDRAIQRGVAALKLMQKRDGTWNFPMPGATSLAGLALLECDVKPEDRSVVAAAEHVRQTSVSTTHTYSIALAIVFLDRLGDSRDIPLIESLMIRLLAGQNNDGGWAYNCPPIADAEVTRLRKHLSNWTELKGGKGLPKPRPTVKDLSPEIQQQLTLINRQPGRPGMVISDNSNTQFATLAIWVGRRHGFPVEDALGRISTRFRMSQNDDGSWPYMPHRAPVHVAGTATMTCAGGLGLAVALGAMHDPDARRGGRQPLDPAKDLALQKALLALGASIGDPVGKDGKVPVVNAQNGRSYYFLWSLERLAVALNLETINKKDWYNWGAEVILANQRPDGSWQGEYGSYGADTAFALLFLKRANLMKDLSANLKGKTSGLGEHVLRGGVGLIKPPDPGKSLKAALGPQDKEPEDPRPKNPPAMKPLPTRVEDSEVSKLSTRLVEAKADDQDRILKELRDSKGSEYTEALAVSIPRLQGETREKTRYAFAERLSRMSATQLEKYLKDDDAEIRRAATNATYMKGLRDHVPLLIERLQDTDAGVVRTAHVALKEMTKQDFGPDLGATREDIEKAIKDWKDWWNKQKR
jgi:hypothetical protein